VHQRKGEEQHSPSTFTWKRNKDGKASGWEGKNLRRMSWVCLRGPKLGGTTEVGDKGLPEVGIATRGERTFAEHSSKTKTLASKRRVKVSLNETCP